MMLCRPVKAWDIIDRVQDGKIKETRLIMDSLGLMMQLGVFTVGKSMMSPPPKHAPNRFSYPFLSSWRNPPFAGAKNYRKEYWKSSHFATT